MQIVVAEPADAALLTGKPWTPHKIQGWTPDFVPAVLNREVPDRIVTVTDAEAIAPRARSRHSEGIFVRHLLAARTFAAALKVAAQAPAGQRDPRDAAGHRRALSVDARCSRASPMARDPEP